MSSGSLSLFAGRSRLVPGAGEAFAVEAERVGFRRLWIADVDAELDVVGRMLRATTDLTVGSSVLSIWLAEAEAVAARFAAIEVAHPGRFTLGIGVSHGPLVERLGRTYDRPYSRLVGYLDRLFDDPRVSAERVVLGANGPKMLALAASRTAGVVPYLVTPEGTAAAREHLGAAKRLVPVQKVVLDRDRGRARDIAREELAIYLSLPNYTSNLLRLGFTQQDLEGGGSDRLVDALVACGDLDVIADRVAGHLEAGADGVAVHPLFAGRDLPTTQLAELSRLPGAR